MIERARITVFNVRFTMFLMEAVLDDAVHAVSASHVLDERRSTKILLSPDSSLLNACFLPR
jgi:hypothetical protein